MLLLFMNHNDGFSDVFYHQVGGYDGVSRNCLASVECYSPETESWTMINDMVCSLNLKLSFPPDAMTVVLALYRPFAGAERALEF